MYLIFSFYGPWEIFYLGFSWVCVIFSIVSSTYSSLFHHLISFYAQLLIFVYTFRPAGVLFGNRRTIQKLTNYLSRLKLLTITLELYLWSQEIDLPFYTRFHYILIMTMLNFTLFLQSRLILRQWITLNLNSYLKV